MSGRWSAVLLLNIAVLAIALGGCRDRQSEAEPVQFAPFNSTVTERVAVDEPPPGDTETTARSEEHVPATAEHRPEAEDQPAQGASQPPGPGTGPSVSGGEGPSRGRAPVGGPPRTAEGQDGEPPAPAPGRGINGPGDGQPGPNAGRPLTPFERFDANSDGRLTARELPAMFRERMMRADTDGDGAITREEWQAAMRTLRDSWRRGPAGGAGEQRRRGPFDRFDANNDGVLTSSELPEEARERIMRADRDGDGRVTREEWQATMRVIHEGMRRGPTEPSGGDDPDADD